MILSKISDALVNFPPEFTTFLLSMLPISELRGSIPFALAFLDVSPFEAFAYSVAGNVLVCLVIFFFLEPVTVFLRKHSKFMDRWLEKLFRTTRDKHTKRMAELGHLALFLFIAIPWPGSGGWSGTLIAYLFGVNRALSVLIISGGLFVNGVIIVLGADFFLNLLKLD